MPEKYEVVETPDSDPRQDDTTNRKLVNSYATACYIEGYVSTAHPDDEHLYSWVVAHKKALKAMIDRADGGGA